MDVYVIFLSISSLFGILVILLSFYFVLFVESKLNLISLFAIHGHEIVSGISQLFLTIGVVPKLELPCLAGFSDGILTQIWNFETIPQIFILVFMFTAIGWFVALLALIRAFAVSMALSETTKKIILYSHSVHLIIQSFIYLLAGFLVINDHDEGFQNCLKLKPNLRPQMFTEKAVFLNPQKNRIVYYIMGDVCFVALVYSVIALTSGTVLINSLNDQKKAMKSYKHSKAQRDLTSAILCLMITEICGLAVPCGAIASFLIFNVGLPFMSDLCIVAISIYPVIGCYFIWMATPVYKTKVQKFSRFVLHKLLCIVGKKKSLVYNIAMQEVRKKETTILTI